MFLIQICRHNKAGQKGDCQLRQFLPELFKKKSDANPVRGKIKADYFGNIPF